MQSRRRRRRLPLASLMTSPCLALCGLRGELTGEATRGPAIICRLSMAAGGVRLRVENASDARCRPRRQGGGGGCSQPGLRCRAGGLVRMPWAVRGSGCGRLADSPTREGERVPKATRGRLGTIA